MFGRNQVALVLAFLKALKGRKWLKKKNQTPSENQAKLEQYVSEQFAFLVEERGFHAGPVDRVHAGYSNISYLGERIGFDIYMEFNDSTVIEGLINVRAMSGPPSDDSAAPKPRLKRQFFGALRNTLEVSDKRLEQIRALHRSEVPWSNKVFENIIRLDAELVRDYIDALAALSTDELFPLETPKAK